MEIKNKGEVTLLIKKHISPLDLLPKIKEVF